MKLKNGFYYGTVDSSISKLYKSTPRIFAEIPFFELTVLDSRRENFPVDRIVNELTKLNVKGLITKDHLSFTKENLILLLKSRFLNGFDELWGFDRDVSNSFKRPPVALDCKEELDSDTMLPLSQWLASEAPVLGLGDGLGLNYVTPSMAIAHAIEKSA